MKALRILAGIAAVLLAVGYGGWSWLTAREDVPETSDYALDLAALRELAASIPGPLPLRVNHQIVAHAILPRAAVFAGEPLEPHRMTHGVYQVVYPEGSVLIDVAFGRGMFEAEMAEGGDYDDSAFSAVQLAMSRARAIVLTHEHADHIEGLSHATDLVQLAGRLVMNRAQHANESTRELLPAELLDAVNPVAYERAHVVAPGVVLIAAAGHTPGSQIIYVHVERGTEYLFVGDVAWHMDALRDLHYRPRLVTDYFLGEDRAAVLAQFRTLHELLDRPGLQIVVSHDGAQRAKLVENGLLGDGLEP